MTILSGVYLETLIKITKSEQAVIDAAKAWDVFYKARKNTTPEDDDLHLAVQVLLAVENSR